jgi:hypothetical protein
VAEAPAEYLSNNHKEDLLLVFAENFQRQFRQLYADRKPLLLTPFNEYGIPVRWWSLIRDIGAMMMYWVQTPCYVCTCQACTQGGSRGLIEASFLH